ncbi:MAG: hypothetical protein Kow00121_19920 [Elainellaceae cyanobacterium]
MEFIENEKTFMKPPTQSLPIDRYSTQFPERLSPSIGINPAQHGLCYRGAGCTGTPTYKASEQECRGQERGRGGGTVSFQPITALGACQQL